MLSWKEPSFGELDPSTDPKQRLWHKSRCPSKEGSRQGAGSKRPQCPYVSPALAPSAPSNSFRMKASWDGAALSPATVVKIRWTRLVLLLAWERRREDRRVPKPTNPHTSLLVKSGLSRLQTVGGGQKPGVLSSRGCRWQQGICGSTHLSEPYFRTKQSQF